MLPANGPCDASGIRRFGLENAAIDRKSSAWYITNLATEDLSRLLDDCQAGKPAAWEDFHARFHHLIRVTVVKAARPYGCSDQAVLEELVQDTYLRICSDRFKILRSLKAQQPAAVYSLVKSVAYSTAVDEFRNQHAAKRGGHQRPVPLDDLVGSLTGGKSPENQLERQMLLDRLDAHLDAVLPKSTHDRDKAVFWLHFRQGFTASEIAKIASFDLTAKGVESLLHRMIRDLRAKFGGGETGGGN